MLAKIQRFWILFCLAIPCIALPGSLSGQSSDCTGKAAQAQLSSIDPVYVDAMELARNLIDHGFIVKCVQGSKMQNVFEGQKGAALYRTDQGGFEALFLPKGETFAAVEVVEQTQGTRYLYSFRGNPKSPTHMDSSKPNYFIKSGNVLFVVWGDSKLKGIIQAAVTE
jgi:hypothetical protein